MPATNILHVIDTLGVGGAEKVLVGTVNSLPEFSHHVIYLNGSDSLAKHLPSDCKISKLDFKSKSQIFTCAWKLRRYIRENNIQIVHSHLFMATLISRLACPKSVQLFTTIHSLPSKSYFADGRLARWMEKLTYRKRHHIIAICHEVFNDYNQCIGVKGPYTILYNYVEENYYAADYKRREFKEEFRLVAVGNFKAAKNYPYLLKAFRKMPPNVKLDIYGSGPLENQLIQEIEKYKLNVKLCGVREDIHNVLPQYDAFIMSSIFEGQPISLLEAMACGMPAILSDIPVLREATNNQAIFYDLENVDDLVSRMQEILANKINLDEYARAGFERIRKIARKDNYMAMLKRVYLSPELYRIHAYQIPVIKNLRPGLSISPS